MCPGAKFQCTILSICLRFIIETLYKEKASRDIGLLVGFGSEKFKSIPKGKSATRISQNVFEMIGGRHVTVPLKYTFARTISDMIKSPSALL